MSQIEARVFAAGMPIAALMEKVAGLISRRIQALYPVDRAQRVGVLVGPGHNGGDALVVARELHLSGYQVKLYQPFTQLKELTGQHAQYAASLGIPRVEAIAALQDCDFLVDGLFGFGLTRSLEGSLAAEINQLNQRSHPVISIDLPSGIHTDTGAVLGTAIRATQTLCLGLWKWAFFQDQALEFLGEAELIDFGLPLADIQAVLGENPLIQRITPEQAIAALPLPRPLTTHKYQQGHLLLICGSRRFTGAATLAGLAARASGVGMLSIAVPNSLKLHLATQLPDALIIGCPEDETGAIAQLQPEVNLDAYDVIACGPGLTLNATPAVEEVLATNIPVVLDADGLNCLAHQGGSVALLQRQAATVLTPHPGEFKRLFPILTELLTSDRIAAVQKAAQACGAIVLLKGARTAIANPLGRVWVNPASSPALARGGSGDVLTGLMGGVLAQGVKRGSAQEAIVCSATWWHAQAAILAAADRTELGVDAFTLSQYLLLALKKYFP
jgi:NAD(P)H-hydrate epimerase